MNIPQYSTNTGFFRSLQGNTDTLTTYPLGIVPTGLSKCPIMFCAAYSLPLEGLAEPYALNMLPMKKD